MLANVFHIHAQVSRRDNHGALTFEQRRPRLVLIVTTAGNMRQWYPYNGHHLSHAAHESETPIERWSERFRGTTPDRRVSASATKLAPWIQFGSDEPNLVTCVVEPSTPHIHCTTVSVAPPTHEREVVDRSSSRSSPALVDRRLFRIHNDDLTDQRCEGPAKRTPAGAQVDNAVGGRPAEMRRELSMNASVGR
jgi:hypothetical protein